MSSGYQPAAIDVAGEMHMRDARGYLVPLTTIKPVDLLMDEVTRSLLRKASAHSDALTAFKVDAFAQVRAFMDLLAQHHATKLGGTKGNVTLTSYDGLFKVQVQVADVIELGPELQVAKSLIDECLTEWASGSGAELRAIVNRAFSVEKEGQINRNELLRLMQVNITDPRWVQAMEAIRASMRVIGSREYIRFYRRDRIDGAWQAVTLDLASA